MRGALRIIAGLAGVLAVLAAALFFFRAPIAEAAGRAALRSAGVENPAFTVKDFGLGGLEATALSAGPEGAPAAAIDRLAVRYDLGELLAARRVRSIEIGEGTLSIAIDEDGAIRVAGMALPQSDGGGALPFDALRLDGLTLDVETPAGAARGRLEGDFTPEQGGAFALDLSAEKIGVDGMALAGAAVDGRLTLDADGAARLEASARGDLMSAFGALRGVALRLSGEASSWRDALAGRRNGFAGRARLDLQQAEFPAREAPSLAALLQPARQGGAPIEQLFASGAVLIEIGGGAASVRPVDGAALRIVADRGDALTISAVGGAPFYESGPAGRRAGATASLTGEALAGEARLSAASAAADAAWSFEADATFADQTIAGVAFGATTFVATGEASMERVVADVALDATVAAAEIGRFRINDAPVAARLSLVADLEGKTLRVDGDDRRCLTLERARFAIDGQDTQATLASGAFCPDGAPLVEIGWNGADSARVAGRLSAREASYRVGETVLEGAPPEIVFAADYAPEASRTQVEGVLTGGAVTITRTILVSGLDALFSMSLDAAAMTGEATIASARLSQAGALDQVAPVDASGTLQLADDRLAFEFAAWTPKGLALGLGEGAHNLRTGHGEATFGSGALIFEAGGLQPAALAPGLRGIVGATTGSASATVALGWGPSPEDATSSATFALDDVSFVGPGTAVSETRGLTGALKLSSLAPLKSDGVQTVEIAAIDMNALLLSDGVVRLDLPGDETLRIVESEFPWFGGRIGAYDATASLDGSTAAIPLRAEAMDLKQIFEFVKVPGLSGEGVLTGVLPLAVTEGKASIVGGEFKSEGPGAIRYVGDAADAAASASEQSSIAFSILRDLRYTSLRATIDGPLDGRLDIKTFFEGTGEVALSGGRGRVPVKYNIAVDAALLELLNQAQLTTDLGAQIERSGAQEP